MQCNVCQRNIIETLGHAGLLQPLPIPTQVWYDISIDFIGGLPKLEEKIVFLLLRIDLQITKYAHFFSLTHPYTTVEVWLSYSLKR